MRGRRGLMPKLGRRGLKENQYAPSTMKTSKMRIVCGTDFSVHAAQAATVAAMLATRLNETLILIHVVENAGLGATSSQVGDSFLASVREQLHREAERLRKLGTTV